MSILLILFVMTMFLLFIGWAAYFHPQSGVYAPRAFGFLVFIALLLLGLKAFVFTHG